MAISLEEPRRSSSEIDDQNLSDVPTENDRYTADRRCFSQRREQLADAFLLARDWEKSRGEVL